MIVGVGGNLGSGKTLFIVICGKIYQVYYSEHENIEKEQKKYVPFAGDIDYQLEPVKEYKIYSNFKTTFSELVDPLDFMKQKKELQNCLILITEAHTFFDSRISGSTANRLQGYFFLQTRKRNTHVIYDAQLLGSVDLRLRYVSDYYVFAEGHEKHFSYTLFNPNGEAKTITLTREQAREKVYPIYDSYERITPLISSTIPLDEVFFNYFIP